VAHSSTIPDTPCTLIHGPIGIWNSIIVHTSVAILVDSRFSFGDTASGYRIDAIHVKLRIMDDTQKFMGLGFMYVECMSSWEYGTD
jgi:hypothetical protein